MCQLPCDATQIWVVTPKQSEHKPTSGHRHQSLVCVQPYGCISAHQGSCRLPLSRVSRVWLHRVVAKTTHLSVCLGTLPARAAALEGLRALKRNVVGTLTSPTRCDWSPLRRGPPSRNQPCYLIYTHTEHHSISFGPNSWEGPVLSMAASALSELSHCRAPSII